MPSVVLNGEPRQLEDGATATDAARAGGANVDGRGVAIAVDGEVLPRGSWDSAEIAEGARIEVLQAVQGG